MREIEKKTGYFESYDGTKIYYEVRGQGRPIVFVYGIACLMNHWHPQMDYFAQNNYQTIAFDFRGHQKSEIPKDPNEVSIDALARDTHMLLKHLGIESASFFGHSFGGQVLLKAYELYPEQFENLVFVNAFVKDPITGMFGTDLIPKVFNFVKNAHEQFPEVLAMVWRAAVLNPFAGPLSALAGGFNLKLTSSRDIDVYAKGLSSLDLGVFIKLFGEMMKYDGSPVLPNVKVPTLVISGDADGVTPKSHQLQLHDQIKGSELQNFPFGSHCTQLDLPEFVNMRVDKFFGAHGYKAEAVKVSKPRAEKMRRIST